MLLTDLDGAPRAARAKECFTITATRGLPAQYFTFADETRGKLLRATAFTPRTAQDERIAAVFHDRLRLSCAVGA